MHQDKLKSTNLGKRWVSRENELKLGLREEIKGFLTKKYTSNIGLVLVEPMIPKISFKLPFVDL